MEVWCADLQFPLHFTTSNDFSLHFQFQKNVWECSSGSGQTKTSNNKNNKIEMWMKEYKKAGNGKEVEK